MVIVCGGETLVRLILSALTSVELHLQTNLLTVLRKIGLKVDIYSYLHAIVNAKARNIQPNISCNTQLQYQFYQGKSIKA